MDLFVVNRFLGDKVEEINKDDEKAKLAELLSKIEQRKKQRELRKVTKDALKVGDESSIIPVAVDDEVDGVVSKKKRKQGNISSADETVPTESKIGEKKKKKKKKRELNESSDEDDYPNTVNPENKEEIIPGDGFTILGTDHFEKKKKVKRVLPTWLAKPSIVSVNLKHLSTTIDDIPGIDVDLRERLRSNSITHFFPVQCQVIPWLLARVGKPPQYWPRDVCVSAPTGSGKTLAYVIPIVQALKCRVVPHIRALVVVPVQELAVQVAKVFETYCVGTDLKVALVTGQKSFSEEQRQLLRTSIVCGPQSRVDIIVATTGRIVDHLQSTPGFSLKHLSFLVIDEADRIMETIKNDWLHHLNKHINSFSNQLGQRHLSVTTLKSVAPPPQKLLFSATLSQDPEKLQQLGLFQPILFTSVVEGQETEADIDDRGDFVGKYTMPSELVEKVCIVEAHNKPLAIYHMIETDQLKNLLCFVDMQVQAHRLAILLKELGQGRLKVAEISAALTRKEREAILAEFGEGKIDVLVSTDQLARGIDLPIVDNVISYNAPKFVKNYIHRVGRTARAGKVGTAITFVHAKQKEHFQVMLKGAGRSPAVEIAVSDEDLEAHSEIYAAATEQMKLQLKQEQDANLEKTKEEKRSRKPKRRQKVRNKPSRFLNAGRFKSVQT